MEPITAALLAWYDRHARVMPWRGIQDPYRTWVSEIMLQQTRVETVIPYYHRFLARFPTLEALAAAEEADVLKEWEGLGYYSRARNLLAGARQVMREYGGQLPGDPKALQKIRGIGPYTAGAIASIAFQVPVPAIDGNVIRVMSRLYRIREDVTEPVTRKRLEALAAALVPEERPGDYNQAVMDLGATICVPGTPECDACPLFRYCMAGQAGDAGDLPRLPEAKAPKPVFYLLPLILSGNRVLMRERKEKLLQGLWCFPLIPAKEETAESDPLRGEFPFPVFGLRDEGHARHVFTHLAWEMRLLTGETEADAPAPPGYQWIPLAEISSLPVPTAMKAAMDVLRRKGLITR